MLLSGCQGIEGHQKMDFDFCTHLSYLFTYVKNVLFCALFFDQVESPGVRLQSIHQPEMDLLIWLNAMKLQSALIPC